MGLTVNVADDDHVSEWCTPLDLNQHLPAARPDALPIELGVRGDQRQIAGAGLEPATYSL